jgi:hypothetical protein
MTEDVYSTAEELARNRYGQNESYTDMIWFLRPVLLSLFQRNVMESHSASNSAGLPYVRHPGSNRKRVLLL